MRSDMYDKMSDDDLVPVYERDAIKIIIAGAECGITTTQVWNYFRPSMASVDKWR
jgi:hypothetical protein